VSNRACRRFTPWVERRGSTGRLHDAIQFRSGSHEEHFQNVRACEDERQTPDGPRAGFRDIECIALPVNVEIRQEHVESLRLDDLLHLMRARREGYINRMFAPVNGSPSRLGSLQVDLAPD
jgi:hypothetical protein